MESWKQLGEAFFDFVREEHWLTEEENGYLEFVEEALAEGWPENSEASIPDDVVAAIEWYQGKSSEQARVACLWT